VSFAPDLVSAAETIVARTARDGEFSADRGQPVGKMTTPSDGELGAVDFTETVRDCTTPR